MIHTPPPHLSSYVSQGNTSLISSALLPFVPVFRLVQTVFSWATTSFTQTVTIRPPESAQKIHSIAGQTLAGDDWVIVSSPLEKEMKEELHHCKAATQKMRSIPLRSELRDLYLATAKEYNFKTVREVKEPNFTSFESLGGRPEMQDATIHGVLVDTSSSIRYMGILDGHGTTAGLIVQYVLDHFEEVLRSHLPAKPFADLTSDDVHRALTDSFATLNGVFSQSPYRDCDGGTTFSITLEVGNKLYTANSGDSRMILLRKNEAVCPLTDDAKAGMGKTLSRFGVELKAKMKGKGYLDNEIFCLNNGGPMYVHSTVSPGCFLGMVSSMGDFHYFPDALKIPKISGPIVKKKGDRLFGASDGVFDLHNTFDVLNECKYLESSLVPKRMVQLSMGKGLLLYKKDGKIQPKEIDNTTAFIADL